MAAHTLPGSAQVIADVEHAAQTPATGAPGSSVGRPFAPRRADQIGPPIPSLIPSG